jgi:hypothetical protein
MEKRDCTMLILAVCCGMMGIGFSSCDRSKLSAQLDALTGASAYIEAQYDPTVSTCKLGIRSKVLLSTRFKDLAELHRRVSITYDRDYTKLDSSDCSNSAVYLVYVCNGDTLRRTMTSGISQDDVSALRKPDQWARARFVLAHPDAIRKREDLETAYMLSRRKPTLFGPGSMTFYDLAEISFRHINTPGLAYQTARDSSEKGYINTFNHTTAQALITSFFSEDLADLIGDLHERSNMPEITCGRFTAGQLADTINSPVDNYVDIINNEIGQQLGLALKAKYRLSPASVCTPQLLAAYLNDLQAYYMGSLEIGMDNYRATDPAVINFSDKINLLLKGSWISLNKAITGF